MKLQVTQENLSKALSSVARVANSRSTLPILANVILKTISNRLSIAATNLDIAITHYIGAKVEEEGEITVPARLMQDFINTLPNGVINLELEDNKLHITTDQHNSTINGMSSEEFPVMPAITGGQNWKVPAGKFKQALQQTIFSASVDESRPVLTGVYVYDFENNLYVVATDSYRLAEKQLMTTKQNIKLLIPANALQDLLRLITDDKEEVEVNHNDQQILFKVGDIELVARLIEGKYPDYRKLIPQKFNTTARINKNEFISITKSSSLFAREAAGSITIKIDEDAGHISIHSIASQLGENTASAKAQISGSGEITLNSRYLLDGLSAMESDEIEFCFNGKLDPSILRSPKDSDYIHVIMPLKS